MMAQFDVFGVENSLIDIQAFVSNEFLREIGVSKGIMHLIDEERSQSILKRLEQIPKEVLPGGSCANTIKTVAFLGGNPVYTGIVSNDDYGRIYAEKLRAMGVTTLIKIVSYGMTGSSIILTTPDAERTMNTHLGVCRDYTKDDIDVEVLQQSRVFHSTGYMWDTDNQKQAALFAMEQAKQHGLKVSFDIADPFLVERNRGEFPHIIKDYVDILFGNAQEVMMLTDIDSPLDAGKALQANCEIVAVKMGKDGSCILSDQGVENVGAFPVEAIDSTGAGDVYAGGFLYGFCQGKALRECGRYANYIASRIVTVKGLGFHVLDQEQITRDLLEHP
jgi:sugar/nucleoside kinase (ribokinase family)